MSMDQRAKRVLAKLNNLIVDEIEIIAPSGTLSVQWTYHRGIAKGLKDAIDIVNKKFDD